MELFSLSSISHVLVVGCYSYVLSDKVSIYPMWMEAINSETQMSVIKPYKEYCITEVEHYKPD